MLVETHSAACPIALKLFEGAVEAGT